MQVCDGPQLSVRLLANLTTPAVELSTDYIDFGLVKCGECHIVSVQLYNAQPVTCHWDSTDHGTAARRKRKVRQDMTNVLYLLTVGYDTIRDAILTCA